MSKQYNVMPLFHAKIIISHSHFTSQEFFLHQSLISIGRAPDNHIVLSESGVSRHHAQIAHTEEKYAIADLGSADGTSVNGIKLLPHQPLILAHGDIIHIGSAQLQFWAIDVASESSPVDSTPALQETAIVSQPASISSSDTTIASAPSTPMLRVCTGQWTQEFPLEQDVMILGRGFESDIVVDASVVSVRHAEIRKCNTGYEIVDLNSTNGLVYEGRPIAQKRLEDGDVLYIGSTVRLEYQALPVTTETALPIQRLELSGRPIFTIGRDPNNDAVIDHPAVSRFHARVQRQDGTIIITDLNSTNGTFVNGRRLKRDRPLKTNDASRIGAYRLVFGVDETLTCKNEADNIRLDALHINKVTDRGINILQDISLSIRAKELVAIASESNVEKSALLEALSGYNPATQGEISIDETDLYKNFPAYRHEIGYVPQNEVIHQK